MRTRLLALLLLAACSQADPTVVTPPDAAAEDAAAPDAAPADGGIADDAGEVVLEDRRAVTHVFGEYALEPRQEVSPCVTWKLDNEEALYVEKIVLQNRGGFHHSNWFVVPEGQYAGPDGFFRCRDRGFSELIAAATGTVLFAQSTQSRYEEQHLGEGVVIKIPPRHRIIAGAHLLNLSDRAGTTELRMSLELLHPRLVETIVSPFRIDYYDLAIDPETESRHTATCDLKTEYERAFGGEFDLKLHWILPHYHELGNYFRVAVHGGPRDGETLFEMQGFDGDANGRAYPQPIDLTGATGLSMTCGFRNPRDEVVGYGIGDQEMCTMLGFADARGLLDASVRSGDTTTGVVDGRPQHTGPCTVLAVSKSSGQSMPTEVELTSPLYLPSAGAEPIDVIEPPACVDTPADATPLVPPTLTALSGSLFVPSCAFSSCHAGPTPAAELDLSGPGLHAALSTRVVPGDPEASALYQRISRCEPRAPDGTVLTNMPLNAPTLVDPGLVASVRQWIEDGARE